MRIPLALALLSVLPLAAACSEPGCADPSEVDVVAAAGTSPSLIGAARDAVADFAGWTGGQAVCVDTVYLSDELPRDDVDGMVTGREAWVPLTDEARVADETVHQLCHAADQALGLSVNSPFADEEAFATACTEGPKAAEEKAYAVCAAGDRGAHLLLDELFVGTWPQRIEEGEWRFDDAVGSVGFGDDGAVVPARDGAAVLEWALDDGAAVPSVRLIEEGRYGNPIPGPAVAPDAGWKLFGGGGEHPILVLRDANGTHAVRFDLDRQQALYVPVPRDLAADEAVVADGALWAVGRVEGLFGAWRVDLETGVADAWPTPMLVERPLASHGRIAVPHGDDVLVYDVQDDVWTAWPLPLELTALEAMPDAGGSLSVRWGQADARGLARMEAPMGTVQLDVASCNDPIASDAQGTWVAGPEDAAWSAPDRTRGQLDVLTVSLQ